MASIAIVYQKTPNAITVALLQLARPRAPNYSAALSFCRHVALVLSQERARATHAGERCIFRFLRINAPKQMMDWLEFTHDMGAPHEKANLESDCGSRDRRVPHLARSEIRKLLISQISLFLVRFAQHNNI